MNWFQKNIFRYWICKPCLGFRFIIFNLTGFALYLNPEKICGLKIYFELITKTDYGNIYLFKYEDGDICISNNMGGRMKKDIHYMVRI
jgi:hypothetical protein